MVEGTYTVLTEKDVLKEGVTEKQSRWLKSWRKRWMVLGRENLFTFSNEKDYKNPTEEIPLKSILSIKNVD
jgi:hypothetical protein